MTGPAIGSREVICESASFQADKRKVLVKRGERCDERNVTEVVARDERFLFVESLAVW